eukprot:7082377-Heterocapsa_arctica.AAC.1
MLLGSLARFSSWYAGPCPGYSRLRTQIHGAVCFTLCDGFCTTHSCCLPLARPRLRAAAGGGAGVGTAPVLGAPAHSVHQAWPGTFGAGV